MRSEKLLIAGLLILLLAGLAGGAAWLMGGQDGPSIAHVPANAVRDPGLSMEADPATDTISRVDHEAASTSARTGNSPDDDTAADMPRQPEATPESRPPADPEASADDDAIAAAQAEKQREAELRGVVEQSKAMLFKVRIAGRVMDETGRSVDTASLRVSFEPANPAHARSEMPASGAISQTVLVEAGRFDAWLQFEVPEGMDPVNLFINATAARFATGEPAEIKSARNGSEHANIEVVMQIAATLIGRVVDRSMRPIEGAAVYAVARPRAGTSRLPQMQTNKDGGFRFDNLAPGTWVVTVTSTRHSVLEAPPTVELTAGAEFRMSDVIMVPTTVLRLRVLRADGSALASDGKPTPVTVKFVLDGGRSASSASPADAQGNVTIHRVPGDAREFTVSARGFNESETQYLNNLRWNEENDGGEVRLTATSR